MCQTSKHQSEGGKGRGGIRAYCVAHEPIFTAAPITWSSLGEWLLSHEC